MSTLNPEDLVLVAILPSPRDLEIARVLGWYRVPLQHAPKILRVDWIAFYQTAAYGPERWSVRYLAPVTGFELTTRAQLLRGEPDHPRAEEPYLKFQLGPLEALPQPILAGKWKRFTFGYTSGARLLQGSEWKDLTLPADTLGAGTLLRRSLGGKAGSDAT